MQSNEITNIRLNEMIAERNRWLEAEDSRKPANQGLTLRVGDLAFFDTFSGMVPCKVTGIAGRSGPASSAQIVRFTLTGKRGAYRKGEKLESSGLHVVPRGAVKANGWLRSYQVEVDA